MYSVGVMATKRLAEIIRHATDEKVQTVVDPILVPRNSTKNPNSASQ